MTFSGRVKGIDVAKGLDSGQIVMALLFIFTHPILQQKEQNKHFTKRFNVCFHSPSYLDLLPQTFLDHKSKPKLTKPQQKHKAHCSGYFYFIYLLGRKGR